MKAKYLIGLLCAAALVGLFTITKAPAQQGNLPKHAAVMLVDTDTWHRGPNFEYIQTGRHVVWVEASPGVPTVEPGVTTSAAIAYYMDLGFSHEILTYGFHLFKK